MDNRERIEELSYQPAITVVRDDDGPVSGQTTFCGVEYSFSRRPDDYPGANEWGDWYDLIPIDAGTGLPMRAMGHFRSPDSVRWTSMGSPALTNTVEVRLQFRGFITRLIDETATNAHWDSFCVAHYRDDVVEEVRRECVRLFLNRETLSGLGLSDIEKLKSLANRLTVESGG